MSLSDYGFEHDHGSTLYHIVFDDFSVIGMLAFSASQQQPYYGKRRGQKFDCSRVVVEISILVGRDDIGVDQQLRMRNVDRHHINRLSDSRDFRTPDEVFGRFNQSNDILVFDYPGE